MDPKLNEALTEVVRRWARPTTPEELTKRGVSRVRSVSLSRVASLIEKAVNRTLIARTIGDLPEDADSFSEATGKEFMRMLRTESTEPGPTGERAHTALERLKSELAERRRLLAEAEAEAERGQGVVPRPDEDVVLERKLRQVFAAWGGDPLRPSPMEREIISLAVHELQAQRAHVEASRVAEHRHEIDVLERRIAKLSGLLERTEHDLQRMVAKGQIDPGLASIYESVQGLNDTDPKATRKVELMASIFEANLRIRDQLGAG